MEGLEELQRVRGVVEDFTSRTLAGIPSGVSRLLHVATLCDLATGRYRHDGMAEIYSEQVVDQALRLCHEQLFERILETPLKQQEVEFRTCLQGFNGSSEELAERWQEHEFYKLLIPSGAPSYLRHLFCSNAAIILRLIAANTSTNRVGA